MDVTKVIKQHLEMEQFFSGFSLKGKAGATEPRPSKTGRGELIGSSGPVRNLVPGDCCPFSMAFF